MRIKNARLFPSDLAFGTDPKGQAFLALIVKGTFTMERGRAATAAAEQLPVFDADVPVDPKKPGGLLRFESDLVAFKPRGDIVLVGSAHAEGGRPVKTLDVEMRVGRTRRVLRVVGNRLWSFPKADAPPVVVGPAEFTTMPLGWDRAFGGIDPHGTVNEGEPDVKPWCPFNFEGRGFAARLSPESLHEKALPNIEDPEQPITAWNSRPRPKGCAFFPRNSLPRSSYLGTFDAKWKAERAPEMPADFRYDFFNAAAPDLQVEGYLAGNEPVLLSNVTPGGGRLEFLLPGIRPVVTVRAKRNGREPAPFDVTAAVGKRNGGEVVVEFAATARIDTLVFLPEEKRFYLVWRAVIPIESPDATDVEEIRIEYEPTPPFVAEKLHGARPHG